MVPPIAGVGPSTPDETAPQELQPLWLAPERQSQLRAVLLGLVLFVGLAVWVFHSVATHTARPPLFVEKLRAVGILTWIYALVQLLDMRFYHSRFARRRRESLNVPENILGWLLGQMLAWFGILYFAFTQDLRWYVAGLIIVGLTFWGFPIIGKQER